MSADANPPRSPPLLRLLNLLLHSFVFSSPATPLLCSPQSLIGFYLISVKIDDVYNINMPNDIKEIYRRISLFCTLGIDFALETTPLECLGVTGYTADLVFWIVLPFVIVGFIVLGSFCWLKLTARSAEPNTSEPHRTASAPERLIAVLEKERLIAVLEKASQPSLKFLFLMFPVLSRKAFQAFACYDFEDGNSYLRADVRIVCGTDEHTQAKSTATLAILLYPIGQFVAVALLLFLSRDAITSGTPSRLSTAIAFLHREYVPRFFWWEV